MPDVQRLMILQCDVRIFEQVKFGQDQKGLGKPCLRPELGTQLSGFAAAAEKSLAASFGILNPQIDPYYKVAKNLAELCSSILWKIELMNNETIFSRGDF